MGRLRYKLEQCLPPLEWTDQLCEFATAPTPPPAIPIPFPQGLFSPLTSPHSPPQEHLRFPGTRNFGEDGWGRVSGKNTSCKQRRQLNMEQKYNNVVLGVEGRRTMRAGRRGVTAPVTVPGVAPVVPVAAAPLPDPLPVPQPVPAPTPAPVPAPFPTPC